MLRGTVYHCPATEFQRMTYLVGSESGVMREWTNDFIISNAKCKQLADVSLMDAPIRIKIDNTWERVWLHDHVVRVTGCLDIPENIVAYVTNHIYQVFFIYPSKTLRLHEVTIADMTRIRHWFHKEIECNEGPPPNVMLYPLDPLHILQQHDAQTVEEIQSCPPTCPCTSAPTLAETVQIDAAAPLPTSSTLVPTTLQTSA